MSTINKSKELSNIAHCLLKVNNSLTQNAKELSILVNKLYTLTLVDDGLRPDANKPITVIPNIFDEQLNAVKEIGFSGLKEADKEVQEAATTKINLDDFTSFKKKIFPSIPDKILEVIDDAASKNVRLNALNITEAVCNRWPETVRSSVSAIISQMISPSKKMPVKLRKYEDQTISRLIPLSQRND